MGKNPKRAHRDFYCMGLFVPTLWGWPCCHAHFIGEKTEAQRREPSRLRFPTYQDAEAGFISTSNTITHPHWHFSAVVPEGPEVQSPGETAPRAVGGGLHLAAGSELGFNTVQEVPTSVEWEIGRIPCGRCPLNIGFQREKRKSFSLKHTTADTLEHHSSKLQTY